MIRLKAVKLSNKCLTGPTKNRNNSMDSSSSHNEIFDAELYLLKYKGFTKIQRALLLSKFPQFQMVALQILHSELKQSLQSAFYSKLFNDKIFDPFLLDKEWIESVNRQIRERKDNLETEISFAKNSANRDAIRIAFNNLGDFYNEIGEFDLSLRQYNKGREYASSNQNDNAVVSAIVVSLDCDRMFNVTNLTCRISSDSLQSTKDKCCIAEALFYLSQSRFYQTAHKLLETSGEILDNDFSEVIAVDDIAKYVVLCSLASFDRNEIRSNVLNNVKFKDLLDICPSYKSLILLFLDGQYKEFMKQFNILKIHGAYDLYLQKCIISLEKMIVDKLYLNYIFAYNTLDLHVMANMFDLKSPNELFPVLSDLILTKRLNAKINTADMTLNRREENVRNEYLHQAQQMVTSNLLESQRCILRLSLLANNFTFTEENPEGNINPSMMIFDSKSPRF